MMSIRSRIFLTTLILNGILLLGLWGLEREQRIDFYEITNQQQKQLQSLFSHAIEQEQQNLQTLVLDFTFWDELVKFAEYPDEAWAKNILLPSMEVFDVDCLWVYSPQNELIYQNQERVCTLYAPHLFKKPENLFQHGAFIKFTEWQANAPAISVYGASIHPSEDVAHQTPPRGYFFVGRIWNTERLQNLNKLSNLEVTVSSPENLEKSMPPSETDLYATYTLKGVDDVPVAYLVGKFVNPYIGRFLKSQEQYRIYSFLLSVSFLALILVTLNIWIIRPLRQLATALSNQDTKALKALLGDKSEFGQIANPLHQFFQQKNEVEKALQQHKEILENLQKSEERYRLITTITSDFTFSIQAFGTERYVIEWGLESFQEILPGITSENFFSQIVQFIDTPSLSLTTDEIYKSLEMGQQITLELRIPQGEGKYIWYRLHLIPEIDQSSKNLIRILGSAQNITGEKTAQEEFIKILEHSNSAEIIADEVQVLYLNSQAKSLIGERESPKTLPPLLSHIHPEDQTKVLSLFSKREAISSSESPILIRVTPADTKIWRWVNLTFQPVLFQHKSATRISLTDITEKRNIELALSAQTQYSTFLSEVFNAWILIFDESGKILVSSKRDKEIFGLSDLTNQSFTLWSLFEFPPEFLTPETFPETIRDRKTYREVPVALRDAKPKRWYLWSHTYLEPQNGDPLRILAVLSEITEQKNRELYAKSAREIAAKIQSEDTQDEILHIIPQALFREMTLEGVAWILFDEKTQSIEMQYPYGELRKSISIESNFRLFEIVKKVTEGDKPVTYSALDVFPDLGLPSYNIVLFPTTIRLHENTYVLATLVEPPIPSSVIEIIESLCKMAGAIIERITSLTQANQRLQYMTSLHLINTSISASLDLNLTLRSLVNQIMGQFQVDAVAVFLVNPTTHMLEYAAGEGFRSIDIARTRMRIGEDQVGKAALTRKTICIYDKNGIAPFFQRAHLFRNEDFIAYYAVPLIAQGEVKGVLETFHRHPFTPSEEWRQFIEALAMETAIAIKNAELLQRIQTSNLELALSYDATLLAWAQVVEWHENQPEGSTLQLAEVAVQFAQSVGINNTDLQHFRQGVILHDIGKLMIPRHVLQKPGPLDETEWEMIRQSPVFAFNLLSKVPLLQAAGMIPYMHHERWDGNGYPLGMRGEEIPFPVRVFTIVNVWDALRSQRPFRKAWHEERIHEFLKENMGKIFDPELVPVFLKFLSTLSSGKVQD
ncbi:HD domain-containing phosphohydrolase [Anaerolinea thermophila]|uniref:Signaling protein n=1 Tax=Anaerolinea thermophila (strain DSM 14523 / JCM 11388 / NBRC 100420 / UNI-1) TaxID=926569 RepID=E8N650_ANATU|nr:HD domain-containing phosphohydrolase [Anaerolinea thermophila]BAJ63914.1 hypothetical protein ANT_18880 [Anaerolinea thermophila UNI-1]